MKLRIYIICKGEYCGLTDEGMIFGVYSTEAKAKKAVVKAGYDLEKFMKEYQLIYFNLNDKFDSDNYYRVV